MGTVRATGKLGEADIRATYRVVLDSLDAGHDPIAWRRRLLAGLSSLIDSEMNVAALMPADPGHRGASVQLTVFYGPAADSHDRWLRRFSKAWDTPSDPLTGPMMRHWHRPLTARLGDLMDYAAWRRTAYAQEVYLANGVHDIIHSRVPRSDLSHVPVLGLYRTHARRRFTERERRIVEIAHGEMAGRIAKPAAAPGTLSARLQELATHLRGPFSEKEIAREMRLSPHTVHNYMRSLYRRLGVATRSEAVHALRARDARSGDRNEVILA